MPWVVGIDEAGYGPNLGPLVQASVKLFLPDDDLQGWSTFSPFIRKAHEKKDGRLVVDDSKKVYSSGRGLNELERTILAISPAKDFQTLLGFSHDIEHIQDEFWFESDLKLPFENTHDDIQKACDLWRKSPIIETAGVSILRPYLTATKQFNEIVDRKGSKAAVVTDRIITMLRECLTSCSLPNASVQNDPILISCDKLGGRHYYGPFLQEAFPEGWPVAVVETPGESRYRILNLGRDVTVTFKPRADAESVPVALASMLAKYLRELCMKQFNDFWQKHLPELKPTAGYPLDAKRYYREIQPLMGKLGFTADQVWRKK